MLYLHVQLYIKKGTNMYAKLASFYCTCIQARIRFIVQYTLYSTAFGTFFSICSYTVNVLPFLVLVLFIHSFLLPFLCDKWYSYFLFSFSLSPYLFPHFLYCLLSSSLVPFICLKLNLGFVLLPFNIQFIFHCFLSFLFL